MPSVLPDKTSCRAMRLLNPAAECSVKLVCSSTLIKSASIRSSSHASFSSPSKTQRTSPACDLHPDYPEYSRNNLQTWSRHTS